ncbi:MULTISPECIES: hypothetical protein [unclassified Mesorhizobium]|uniref:hypothetical protein n=1 Tax=unclassified Mesorhizobium TaxID=325217 RepID=UPI0033382F96
MTSLRKLFWLDRVGPVTHNEVPSAERPAEKEREVKAATSKLIVSAIDLRRKSWEVRRDLAGRVLSIVSGDDQ